ncbi:SOS response-associated peptidase family protein [Acinetobacter sp.]|uniref:SOS response-associated peptidase n=1 Tax=Acinetobacter sp. TaxID=472 RepID=UPI0031CEE753
MCANYRPIHKSRTHLLDLFEPTFDYKMDIYPEDLGPILISPEQKIEWRAARFGLVPFWAKNLKAVQSTYNARVETVADKKSFKHAWNKNQFALVPVEVIFEPKYIDGHAQWYGIYRQDKKPFTVAAIYEYASVAGQEILSMSMLTINADTHPLMNQFHSPEHEKRSVVIISEGHRLDWLNADHTQATELILEFSPDEFTAAPKAKIDNFYP